MGKKDKYYIGLDIGTNSVGIACTDENYNLMRAGGKDCWAVRLFDEAKTARSRRVARTARRRLQRRKYRIGWLQSLFAPYIDDKTFFLRLNNSQFVADDKADALNGDVNTLFADDNFNDKSFHKKFPTIYHLRLALQQRPFDDLRLYYLALHHIVKYRGHFLFEGSVNNVCDVRGLFNALNQACEETYADDAPFFDLQHSEKAKQILLHPKSNFNGTVKELEQLFCVNNKVQSEIIKGFSGGKMSPSKLLGDSYAEEKSFSFKDLTDDAFEAMQSTYGDDFMLLQRIRGIYNFVTFEKLFDGQPNISSAMIAVYDKHKADLRKIKDFVKEYAPDDYRKLFRDVTETANYVNYVGYNRKKSDRQKVKMCKYEDFLAYVKKFLNEHDVPHNDIYNEIIRECDEKTFLPKILHSDNGLVPHQVNEAELVAIVEQMVRQFPQTAEMADKILPLFRFRIPYYVGSLAGTADSNCWVVKKSNERITPWNFDEVVDKAASNERFMRRMTNKCTYLHAEDVLPKCSVLYQKYNLLNQLNKLKVNGCAISVRLKQKIFDELYLTKQRVSNKAIIALLVREGVVSPDENVVLSGNDGEIKASMSSYIQLKRILGDFVDVDYADGGEICENIILWHTLNADKSIVEKLITDRYGNNPSIAPYIKQLKGLTFVDFGRLSRKLLVGLQTADKHSGELLSVMDLLWQTNQNFNEIMFDENYNFDEILHRENAGESEEVTYNDIEKLYVSPAVRRGIWQSLTMVDEYVSALGHVPDKIFVEVTREDSKKGDEGRSPSRKKQLLEKYKNLEGIDDLLAELNSDDVSDMRLRQERLYLYFRQLGRCMYSGKRIDLSQLSTDLYDVDHVLPRTYMKDDSLDNKVLVLRSKNSEKSDRYPLPQGFTDQQPRWKYLFDKGLLPEKTYLRLTRTAPLTEDDFGDFINRQKTITDQTAKAVIELLVRKYPTCKTVYSKARNVSDFKQKFDLYKCRETNDLHHARDAYLNIVVGNVYNTVFSTPMAMFSKDGDVWRTYNLKKMFTRNVDGAWNENSVNVVKGVFNSTSMSVTRYTFCNKGAFYDQTVYPAGSPVIAPRKGKGPLANAERYGGYKSQKTAYFAIVESDGKKGRIKTIEAVPVLVDYQCKNNASKLVEYFESNGLKNVKIVLPKMKLQQLVSYNGSLVYLTGVSGSDITVNNATQLFVDNKTDEYVNQLSKLTEMSAKPGFDDAKDCYVIKTNRMKEIKVQVDGPQNVCLYDKLLSKFSNKAMCGISAYVTFGNNLRNYRERFVELSVLNQAKVLLQILKFFKCNAELVDLSLIGGSKNSGKIRFNKNITDVDFRLINQSPCGLVVRTKKV